MKMIEAIVRPSRFSEIEEALNKYEIKGLTVTQVMGCGRQKGHKEYYRGNVVNINLLPKMKLEIVAKDEHVDEIVKLICEEARTGEVGDGKIFIYSIGDGVRIRTGERGEVSI